MIADNQTNFLYLADILPIKFPTFYSKLEQLLKGSDIEFALLPHTKDIWAVDYMPVQVSRDRFVQFVYNPDYLRSTQKWRKTIPDVDKICDSIGLKREHSNIILDGGNVIPGERTVIMCDKVFRENPGIKRSELIKQLHECFEIDKLVFIPQDPEDFTGHADGMVRFVDEQTVVVNDYLPGYQPAFQKELHAALHNAGLERMCLPYKPDENSKDSAKGLHINYLQMRQLIIVPTFGYHDKYNPQGDAIDDEIAIMLLEELFSDHTIKMIDCNDIAAQGGVLNCISWNIWK